MRLNRSILVLTLVAAFGLGLTLGHSQTRQLPPDITLLRQAYLCGRVEGQGKKLPPSLKMSCDATHLPTDIPGQSLPQ